MTAFASRGVALANAFAAAAGYTHSVSIFLAALAGGVVYLLVLAGPWTR